MIGGSGERKTLRLVARYADACNLFASDPAVVAHKLEVLEQHCEAESRDPATIEKTIIWASTDRPDDTDAFLNSMEGYAKLGIGQVWVSPTDPDPAGWVARFAGSVVPRLGDL